MDFVSLVKEILVTEMCRTSEEADSLVKRFPNVMVNMMMAGNGTHYRAAAMALEMAEADEQKASP